MSTEHVTAASRPAEGVLATNKVIRNTYMLLSMTLAFSAVMAFVAMAVGAQPVHWLFMLAFFIGFPFLINYLRNSIWSLPLVFVFTGVMGYILGPIIGMYLSLPNGPAVVGSALASTALVFVGLSAYALITRKDFSFLGGFVFVGFLVVLAAIIANIFLAMPALSLAISSAVVLLVSAAILWDTSRMVHDGEANYVVMTVSLYANIYVLFLHLMSLYAMLTGDN
ncbi:modulator of FtsH protease [Ectothiorhodospira magna]|uniref:Modulator of FtsH protease n=1 Tax=Ectothiorhodospira magna TaxID=867345 RepID=A0A1H9E5F1_9GAMM|nr:Bax inhibitor-1/YccA family protein [Ectothiorhodospira magna]SEQ20138.1 modulator of FtsH protease [Ectothiorhodospira magna]